MRRPAVRIPAVERRRQILAVATSLFARQGFQGTRTREISAKACVNEAILFRHFPSKEDLYWAVLDEKCKARRGFAELQRLLKSDRPVPEVFAAIADGLLRRNFEDASVLRLWLFSGLENHRLYRRFYRAYMADYYDDNQMNQDMQLLTQMQIAADVRGMQEARMEPSILRRMPPQEHATSGWRNRGAFFWIVLIISIYWFILRPLGL